MEDNESGGIGYSINKANIIAVWMLIRQLFK